MSQHNPNMLLIRYIVKSCALNKINKSKHFKVFGIRVFVWKSETIFNFSNQALHNSELHCFFAPLISTKIFQCLCCMVSTRQKRQMVDGEQPRKVRESSEIKERNRRSQTRPS